MPLLPGHLSSLTCGSCVALCLFWCWIQLVHDVHDFPGHIACDDASNSEIVVPVFYDDELVAVLDMDCPSVRLEERLRVALRREHD